MIFSWNALSLSFAKNPQENVTNNDLFQSIIIMSRSSELSVRRQNFVRQLRRKDVEDYMRKIRHRLIEERDRENQQMPFDEGQINTMKERLEDEQYSTRSIEDFLRSLTQYTAQSLCRPQLVKLVERALMHVLAFGNNNKQYKEIHSLAKNLLIRLLQCESEQKGRKPLEYCFSQVFDMLANHDFQMMEVWKVVALGRSEVMFVSSFLNFMSFLHHYPSDITDVISTILQIFKNFTATIQGSEKTSLPQFELFKIIEKIEICLDSFQFGDREMQKILDILQNIMKLGSFYTIAKNVTDSKIIPHLFEYLGPLVDMINSQTIAKILEFLALCLSGSEDCTQYFVRKHHQIVPILCKFLPRYSSKPLQYIQPKLHIQTHNFPVLISTMLCLCNLAACQGFFFMMQQCQLLNWMIRASSQPNTHLRQEISIFLYNSVTVASDEVIEIMLEKQVLKALNNVICEEHSHLAVGFGLKSLKKICRQARNFPTNNLAWHYTLKNVTIYCQKLGLLSCLEHLTIGKNEENAQLATNCLEGMADMNKECC